MFHRHKWLVVGVVHHSPSNRAAEGRGIQELAERILMGWTDISLKCSECGQIDILHLPGKWVDERET